MDQFYLCNVTPQQVHELNVALYKKLSLHYKKQYFCTRRFYPLDFFLILDNNVSINSFI